MDSPVPRTLGRGRCIRENRTLLMVVRRPCTRKALPAARNGDSGWGEAELLPISRGYTASVLQDAASSRAIGRCLVRKRESDAETHHHRSYRPATIQHCPTL